MKQRKFRNRNRNRNIKIKINRIETQAETEPNDETRKIRDEKNHEFVIASGKHPRLRSTCRQMNKLVNLNRTDRSDFTDLVAIDVKTNNA
jgi:hypothetical protein